LNSSFYFYILCCAHIIMSSPLSSITSEQLVKNATTSTTRQKLIEEFAHLSCQAWLHPHHASCTATYRIIFTRLVKTGLKIYGPLFVISALWRKGKQLSLQYVIQRILPNVFNSTMFLASYATSYTAIMCQLRNVTGTHRPLNGLIAGVASAFLSVLWEQPGRRMELGIYTLNQFLEVAYRMMASRGMLPYYPTDTAARNTKVALFALAMGTLNALYRTSCNDGKGDRFVGGSIAGLFRLLHGRRRPTVATVPVPGPAPAPAPVSLSVSASSTAEPAPTTSSSPSTTRHSRTVFSAKILLRNFYWRFARGFAFAYGARTAIATLGAAIRIIALSARHGNPGLVAIVRELADAFTLPKSLWFGLFTGLFNGGEYLVDYSLRKWLPGRVNAVRSFLSAGIAGLSAWCYPSIDISMYLVAKALAALYSKGVYTQLLPSLRYPGLALFSLTTSLVIYATTFEGHNVRPAYQRWIVATAPLPYPTAPTRMFGVRP
jgi:N-terminal cysteine-rich region of Transmembrane protein 135